MLRLPTIRKQVFNKYPLIKNRTLPFMRTKCVLKNTGPKNSRFRRKIDTLQDSEIPSIYNNHTSGRMMFYAP